MSTLNLISLKQSAFSSLRSWALDLLYGHLRFKGKILKTRFQEENNLFTTRPSPTTYSNRQSEQEKNMLFPRKTKDSTKTNHSLTTRVQHSSCTGNLSLDYHFQHFLALNYSSQIKVRNVEYKDPIEEEWERFQRAIKEEATVSAQIIMEDQEEAIAERQIHEIEEQMRNWSRISIFSSLWVIDLEKKKEEVGGVGVKLSQEEEDVSSSADEEEFEEYLDWRAKKS
ncbi:hypothetical protein J437_LFUL013502 [Ladona fulva]|uniref:ZNF380 coiled-coil domain-containing protein n=1 Tax=Ladona fulva TaxID=123851 RepID=A0A8K0KIM1_LADFU|nr:hypothetical protein J437_LFUL013502 [Ladona fulva]